MDECKHSVVFGHTCTECGAWVNVTQGKYKQMPDGTWALPEEASRQNSQLEVELRKVKKLALIVDLDQTLIDTTIVGNEEEAQAVMAQDPENKDQFIDFDLRQKYLVRLRPHLREFLEKIQPLYHMQLYTLSERSYASEIVKVIDPDNKFFHGRTLCRDDEAVRNFNTKKNVTAFFPDSDRMVVVLDDTPNVWHNETGSVYSNLVQISRFQYFTRKEGEPVRVLVRGINDTALLRIGEVLEEVHRRYYEEDREDKNVMVVLVDMMTVVFGDCYIYFDNVWQGNERAQAYFTAKAEEFGGTVLTEFVPYCTHVVACNGEGPGVAKAMEYKGIHIVTMAWFEECFLNFQHLDESEERFRVPNTVAITDGPNERTEPPHYSDGEVLRFLFDEEEEEEESSAFGEETGDGDVDISFLKK